MKKIAASIYWLEAAITSFLLCLISVLVFVSAIARTIGRPINWAQDVALLAFGWLTFLGADFLAKSAKLTNIDMLLKILPKSVQKILGIIFDLLALLFLATLVVKGYELVGHTWSRVFNTLHLSYAWCTMAVPVGSALFFCTMVSKTIKDIRRPVNKWGE